MSASVPWLIGVDPGKMPDHAAVLAFKERLQVQPRRFPRGTYEGETETRRATSVWGLRRIWNPRSLPYPQLVDGIDSLANHPELRDRCLILCDATGVGVAIADYIRARNLPLVSITITGGDAPTAKEYEYGFNVPEHALVQALSLAFQTGRIEVDKDLPKAGDFIEELRQLIPKKSRARGRAKFEAPEGKHDDMAFAAALVAWWATRHEQIEHELRKAERSAARNDWDPYDAYYGRTG